ncbi:hypothetical protein BC835DRAFT_889353 [Cytidiella melzeri]|nr:hypothetical protein BC835DRAFT_889353 [Cytidiella melzeri]
METLSAAFIHQETTGNGYSHVHENQPVIEAHGPLKPERSCVQLHRHLELPMATCYACPSCSHESLFRNRMEVFSTNTEHHLPSVPSSAGRFLERRYYSLVHTQFSLLPGSVSARRSNAIGHQRYSPSESCLFGRRLFHTDIRLIPFSTGTSKSLVAVTLDGSGCS